MDHLSLFVDLVLHNRYQITQQLGCGGMGAVYEATDLKEKRQVAIKQMRPGDPNLRLAFQREARILSQIKHPSLPHAIDYFENENGLFIPMEFIPGENLGQLLTNRGIPFASHQVKRWAEELLKILKFLHTQNPPIIHRDIKPANLKLTPQGHLSLLDFGLAKVMEGRDSTNVCILAYTPHYAPLEQIQGESTDDYSDIYALGATLYHLLTGIPPTDSLKRANHILCKKGDPLPQIAHLVQGVPQSLSSLIMKALSLTPNDRPKSASQMLQQLQANIIAPTFKNPIPAFTQPEPIPAQLEATNGDPAYNEATIVRNPLPTRHPHLRALPSIDRDPQLRKQVQISVHFPPTAIHIMPNTSNSASHQQCSHHRELHHLSLINSHLYRTNATLLNYGRNASAILWLISVALISNFLYHSELNPLRATPEYAPSYKVDFTTPPLSNVPTTQPPKIKQPHRNQAPIIPEDSYQEVNIEDLIREEILKEEIQRIQRNYRKRQRLPSPPQNIPATL